MFSRWRWIISFSSCFAGGVFIAACLLDLLPDVEENFAKVLAEIKDKYKVDLDYPVAQFVIVFGFFIILFIEQTVLHFQEQWAADAEREPLLSHRRGRAGGHEGSPGHHHRDTEHQAVHGVSNEVHHEDDGHAQHNHVGHGVFEHSNLRAVMLLLALSFHSVFEGLAIGLQDDSKHMISIFIAVIIHKAVMSFSLGLNIAQSNLSVRSFVLSNVLFSLSSPVGVGIGIGLSDLPSSLSVDICNGVLQGIAGGTFLYITFFEVIL
jgi:zinc transporter 1/2/3